MRTPTQAIIWELWHQTRWGILVNIFMSCLVMMLVMGVGFQWRIDGAPSETQKIYDKILELALLVFVLICSVSTYIFPNRYPKNNGFIFSHIFPRPVSTCRVVSITMTYLAFFSSVLCILVISIYNAVLGIHMPIWPLVLIVPTIVCLFNMAMWSVHGQISQAFCFSLIGFVIGTIGICWFFGEIPGYGTEEFPPALWLFTKLHIIDTNPAGDVTQLRLLPGHYAFLILTMAMTFIVTSFTVTRQRCGDGLGFKDVRISFEYIFDSQSKPSTNFKTDWSAQFWYEMQRSVTPVIKVCVLLSPVILLIACIAGVIDEYSRLDLVLGWIWTYVIVVLGVIAYCAHSISGLKRDCGTVWMSPFDATRPVSTGRLIAIKLLAMASGVTIIGTIIAVAAILSISIRSNIIMRPAEWEYIHRNFSRITEEEWRLCLYFLVFAVLAAIIFFWTFISWLLFGTLWFESNKKSCTAIGIIILANSFMLLFSTYNEWEITILWLTEAWVLVVAIIAGTFLAIAKALKKGLLAQKAFLCVVGIWLFFIITAYAYWSEIENVGRILSNLSALEIALGIAALLMPLASLAATPLALDNIRHQ